MPFALCLDTLLMHALYAGLLALWVGTEILGFQGLPVVFDVFHVGRAAYTLPLMVLPGLVWAYRKRSALTIGLYAPLLAWWAVLQPVAWRWEVCPVYFVGLAGAVLLLIAEMHRQGCPMAIPYRLYGVLIVGGVLVPMSFADQSLICCTAVPPAKTTVGLVICAIGLTASGGLCDRRRKVWRMAFVCGSSARTADAQALRTAICCTLRRQWLPLGYWCC